ncbi:MAG: TrbG/VirB9 family P-type conjugative transfer protein [Sphingomicrobium sp.]
MQTITYDPAQVVQLRGTPGYQLTVQLSPDEQVQNVAVGDSSGWQVSVNAARNLIFVRPNQTSQPTNMTTVTNVRTYNFELVSTPMPTPDMAFNVRFRYPNATAGGQSNDFVDVSAAQRRLSRYRLSGDRLLRPSSISNDGRYTYIVWPKERDLPATYELAGRGEELLVNGIMRDDVLVIDRVITSLIFRRDRSHARADLLPPKRKG